MKKLFTFIYILAAFTVFSNPVLSKLDQKYPGNKFLIAGCSFGSIKIISADGTEIWSMKEVREVDDAWLMPDGSIVYAYGKGVCAVMPDFANGEGAQRLWDIPTLFGGETHSCQPLDNGYFLIGRSYSRHSYLIEINSSGNVRKKIKLVKFGGRHNSFRQVRKTSDGTYFVSQQREGGKALEYDSEGGLIRSFQDGRFAQIRLANGNSLIAGGDSHRFHIADKDGVDIFSVDETSLSDSGITIGFAAGIQVLEDGSFLMCNWGGHGNTEGPAFFIIDMNKNILYSAPETINTLVSTIMCFQSFTDPKTFKILR